MPDSNSERILDEAHRAGETQQQHLTNLRTRASILLSLVTLALALFAGHGHQRTWWLAVAGAAFMAMALCAIKVQTPRGWRETPNIDQLVSFYLDAPDAPDLDALNRDLALIRYRMWSDNERALRRVRWWLTGAAVSMGVLVVALFFDWTVFLQWKVK